MLIRIILIALISTMLPSNAIADELGEWYVNFKKELPGVWTDILRPAIRRTHPNVNQQQLNRIEIRVKEDACEFSPSAGERSDGTPEIVIPTGFLRLWLYSDQARLLFHSGEPRFSDPAIYVRYIRTNLKGIIAKVLEVCESRSSGEQGNVLGTGVARELGLSDEEYVLLLSRLKVQPDQMMLGHQFGYGIMFVVLHEAGHLLVAEKPGIRGEFEMDEFAAKVLRDQKQSTFLAIGGIAVLSIVQPSKTDGSAPYTDICRVYSMVHNDVYLTAQLEEAHIGQFAAAAERQRQYLVREFRPTCHGR